MNLYMEISRTTLVGTKQLRDVLADLPFSPSVGISSVRVGGGPEARDPMFHVTMAQTSAEDLNMLVRELRLAGWLS